MESIDINRAGPYRSFANDIWSCGRDENLGKNMVFNAHLDKHPELSSFLQSEQCTFVKIKVDTYQVVRGIDDVEWWTIDDLNA